MFIGCGKGGFALTFALQFHAANAFVFLTSTDLSRSSTTYIYRQRGTIQREREIGCDREQSREISRTIHREIDRDS
ncbi:hypothetical protein RchiOBHm_Chr2g0141871 [Rosa chinensis]|uniref:Uncharacterized protein n=1 Tax=Rosa chinensis TaxID=74649 RepID=A0A2P6RXR3_ROSCH|nr:hypothetical protein RchiOBHm_Chr2g0141871 [Rosa chinensis]